MKEDADASSQTMGVLGSTFDTLVSQSAKASKNINEIQSTVFITLAKIDHAIYKANAYSAVYANEIDREFSTHKMCRIGKWYKAEGKEAFGTTKGYAQFDIPHQKLHNSVISSVNYLRSTTTNLLAEKDDLIANFIQMEDESKEVFSSLSSMLEESLANK
jgi:hypothetical protein